MGAEARRQRQKGDNTPARRGWQALRASSGSLSSFGALADAWKLRAGASSCSCSARIIWFRSSVARSLPRMSRLTPVSCARGCPSSLSRLRLWFHSWIRVRGRTHRRYPALEGQTDRKNICGRTSRRQEKRKTADYPATWSAERVGCTRRSGVRNKRGAGRIPVVINHEQARTSGWYADRYPRPTGATRSGHGL